MSKYERLITYSDGGARGNPGPAGIGAVIYDQNKKVVAEISEYIGKTTNNQAEYKACLAAVKKCAALEASVVECFLDSELVVKQLKGEYKVRHKDLAPLFVQIHNESLKFKKITYTHIRREFNKEADALANRAMDKILK